MATAAGLTPDERGFAVRAVPWLCVARFGLAVFGYRRTRDLLAPREDGRLPSAPDQAPATLLERPVVPVGAIARGVDIAARHQLGAVTCLPRALVLHRLLRHAGWPAELHMGVRRTGAALDGHAWVTVDGVPVGEAPGLAETFVPIRGAVQ